MKKSSQFNISLPSESCLAGLALQWDDMTLLSPQPDRGEERQRLNKIFVPLSPLSSRLSSVCILLSYKEYKISAIIRPQFCGRILQFLSDI